MDLRAEEASPTPQRSPKHELVLLPRSPQLKSPHAKTSSMRKPVNGETRRLLLDVTASPAKPLVGKKKRVVPRLAAGVFTPKKRTATQNQWEDTASSTSDERQVNAGVYVLENAKTGHCFFGTTWDLKNAAAQNFHDLQIGEHAHQALAKCYQLYGPEASGISFKVLERVAAPPAAVSSSSRKPGPRGSTSSAFDVKQLELLLQRRLQFHRTRRVRKCTLQLVRRRLVTPVLQVYWPRWCRAVATEQTLERVAASISIQSAWTTHASVLTLRQRRRIHAALQLQRFLRVSVLKRMLQRRRRMRTQNASAVVIQRAVRGFLQRCRQLKRKALVRSWFQARKIQAVYRGHRARRFVDTLKRDRYRDRCAVEIQAQVRGHLARCLVRRLRCRQRNSLAAVVIQKRIRGVLARRSFYTSYEQQNERRKRHEAAARIQRVYWSFVRRKLQHVAESLAIQTHGATTIRMAYRNYVAKKFGWAAATYALETTAARRIQRAISSWYFFLGLRRQTAIHRCDKAAQRIQRLVRGRAGRKQYLAMRHLQRQSAAARMLQRLWAGHRFWKALGVLLHDWRRDNSAQIIQKHYRRHHTQQWVARLRRDARRERAAVTLQCAFRRRRAQRQWKRRLQLQRMGPCDECGNQLPAVFVFSVGLELCSGCWAKWQTHMSSTSTGKLLHETMDVHMYRSLRRLVVPVQRGYRRFQQRTALAFGSCGFCDHNAVRTQCESCGDKRFCHTCDELFHSKEPRSLHTRYRIEWTLKRAQAAITLQAQFRRYQQRHTLKERRDAKQNAAAVHIQRVYWSFHQRKATRVMVAAWKQRQQDELQACLTIQRYLRGFLARQNLRQLRRERKSAICIQRVARGRKGRLETVERRQRRDAAVLVQRNVRGRQARHQVAIMRVQLLRMHQEQAAVCIQRHARGFFVRQSIREQKRQAAALAIQCAWRSNRARCELKALELKREQRLQAEEAARLQAIADERAALERRSVITIQCRWRQCRSKHELQKSRLDRARKLRKLQLQRISDLENASATRIQRLVRSRITNQASAKRLRAQRCARGFLSRRCVQTRRLERSSAIRIQRAFRYFTVKRKLSLLIELDNESKGHWVELFDEASGFVYYYNTETKMSSWDKPLELTSRPNAAADGYDEQQNWAEPEWVEYWDENVGASYYYNIKTGEATWTTPAGVIAAATSYDNQTQDDQQQQEYWYGGYGSTDGREALYDTLPDKAKGRIAQAMEYQLSPENDPWADVAVDGYDNNLNEDAPYDYDYGEDTTAVDTEYDINYKIYMTQLSEQNQNEPEDQSEQQQQEDQAEAEDESTE